MIISKSSLFAGENDWNKFYLAFADPCASGDAPGWPLRNLLCAFVHHWYCFIFYLLKILCALIIFSFLFALCISFENFPQLFS